MNKEICYVLLLLSVRAESKANAGHGTEWKDNSSRGGKAALRRLEKRRSGTSWKKKAEEGRRTTTQSEE
jgi:hypothetical protein